MTDRKSITERQERFIDALTGEAKGNIRAAMNIAGYSEHTTAREAVGPIQNEIIDAAKMMIAMNAPKAAAGMVGIIDDPSALGARNIIAAAKEVLDRAGVIKREQIEISGAENGIFILPPKQAS
jgi:hypothetical protein